MPKYPLERENFGYLYTTIIFIGSIFKGVRKNHKNKTKKFPQPLDISKGKDYTLYKQMFLRALLVFPVDERVLMAFV